MNWKKLIGLWNPEKQKEIKGKLLKVEHEKKIKDHTYTVYTLETESNVIQVSGSTVLDKLMELFNVGDSVKIVFNGMKKGEKAEYKDFEVYYGSELQEVVDKTPRVYNPQ